MRIASVLVVALAAVSAVFEPARAEPLYEADVIFPPESRGHVHASSVVECPNGDLLAVWYENGDPLPAGYFSKQRDKSDNVRIGGAWKRAGARKWDEPFVMSDTFGVSDNNPALVADRQDRLWLVHATLTGVPKRSWGSALVRYKVSSDYAGPGPPRWQRDNILVPHPTGFGAVLGKLQARVADGSLPVELPRQAALDFLRKLIARLDDPMLLRLGWMPRAHPLVRADGTVVVPLANENFDIPMMALTGDGGATWQFSQPVPEPGLIQPTLVEMTDGTVVGFFRNSDPRHRIKRSESRDGGLTWSPPTLTELPHPGGGIEAVLLCGGRLAMFYNDKERGPRDRLAVSISADGGKSWQWTRHLENAAGGRFDYPSAIQAKDGTLHVTYSYKLQTIKHVHFDQSWIEAGDATGG